MRLFDIFLHSLRAEPWKAEILTLRMFAFEVNRKIFRT
jgi:hypothetical protein